MPTIDATDLTQPFSMTSPGTADFLSLHPSIPSDANSFSYVTSSGWEITLFGFGFTYDGSGMPTGGTVREAAFYVDELDGTADVFFSGLNIDITDFDFSAGATADNTFWALVLAGETTLQPGTTDAMRVVGDQMFLDSGVLAATDDVLHGADIDNFYAHGDLSDDVRNDALFLGGDDTLIGAFDGAFGDGRDLENTSRGIGGNDVIEYTSDWTGDASIDVYGDFFNVDDTATGIGGDDMLDARLVTSGFGYFYGDFRIIDDTAMGIGGDDLIYGTQMGDYIYGDLRDLRGGVFQGGDDTLYGEGGDDSIYGDYRELNGTPTIIGHGDDYIDGGSGNDLLVGNGGDDTILGGRHNDTLSGGDGDDDLDGGTNEDSLTGGTGDDTLRGGNGGDTLYGGDDADVLFGGNGNDRLYGENGDDALNGDIGNDLLIGGSGDDTLIGGTGDDTLLGGDGDDVLKGGANEDSLSGDDGADTLEGGNGSDALNGGRNDDELHGGNSGDLMLGGANEDMLFGEAGNDTLNGDNGRDTLSGGTGDDTLNGGRGDDELTGDGNSDTFVFSSSFGDDIITDFDAFDDDEVIDLSAIASITDFADLTNSGNAHMTQVGSDVVIDDFVGNTITVQNVNIGDMNAADFVF